ncbi:MAG: glycosyltransferase family 39 protein, partial [Rhodospirillales bacterium]|nr:glycosyltransferase family 39 protein [Rhodospirillales bacterium]
MLLENPGKDAATAGGRSGSIDDEDLLLFLVSLLTLTVFAGLFVLRFLDDNRLTSWQWVFDGTDLRLVFLSLVVGVFFAQAFSRATLRWSNPAIWLFVSSFAVAGFFWRLPEVNIDASRYFIQAKSLEQFGVGYFLEEWGGDIGAWTDLPLVPFLYGLVLSLFGEVRTAIQAFTTLLFSGTVVLTYLIGRTLWNETVGCCAAVLLLGMPYLLTQVPLMLSDVPAMFFLTLAVYATIGAVRHGGARFLVLAPVAITLAMLSKYSNWILLSIVPVIFLTHLDLGLKVL